MFSPEELIQKYDLDVPVGFTFHIGPGWHGVLDSLFRDLKSLGWDGALNAVKEKYGSVKVELGAGDEKMFARLDRAVEESLRTCEQCGKPGELRPGVWWKTRCETCLGQ